MQKKLVMAGVIAAVAIAAPAFAANTIVTTTSGASAAPASATTVLNFNTADAGTEAASKGITLTSADYGGQFSGTTTTGGFTYAAPNPQDGGFYGVGGTTGTNQVYQSYAQFMGANGQAFSNISVFIGSLDAYNVVELLFTGGGFETYNGTQLNGGSDPAFPGGAINVRADFTATNGQTYSGIKFYNNTTQGSLEFDNLAFTTATAAVPEPASWAMMIGGFGMVGGVMRRRKGALRFA